MKKNEFTYEYFQEAGNAHRTSVKVVEDVLKLVDFENGDVILFEDGYECHSEDELRTRLLVRGGKS